MTSSDVNIIFEEEPVEITLNEDPVEIEMPAGQNGQSLHPRGAWSSSEEYGYLDLVSYQGSSYVATKTVPVGTLPTDTGFWMLSAEKGLDGASEWGDIGGDIADQTDLAQALAGKANVGDSYTKAETDALLTDKADADDVYTKTEVDDALADKADSADVYTKDETDTLLLGKAPVILNSVSGSIASFTDGSAAPVTALSVGIEPVQAGTGDPSPDNVRPITGWTSATVTRTGKNLLSTMEVGGLGNTGLNVSSSQRIRTVGYIPVEAGKTYFVSGTPTTTGKTAQFSVSFYTKADFTTERENYQNWTNLGNIFTVPNGIKFARVICRYSDNAGVSLSSFADLQLELGSTASSFEPYQGTSITIDLDGTRYGGTLDVLAGELVVTKGCFTLTGASSEQWGTVTVGSNYYSIPLWGNSAWKPSNTAICDKFPKIELSQRGQITGLVSYSSDNGYRFSFNSDFGITTTAELRTWLSTNPVTICAELASPFTVQLTPSQMQTLLGENHIWVDTGDTSVTYRADTKLFIQEQIAQSETLTRKMIADIATADGKAPKSIVTGDLIIVGDELRKATANIGNGSAITASNSTTATLADVIKALQ